MRVIPRIPVFVEVACELHCRRPAVARVMVESLHPMALVCGGVIDTKLCIQCSALPEPSIVARVWHERGGFRAAVLP